MFVYYFILFVHAMSSCLSPPSSLSKKDIIYVLQRTNNSITAVRYAGHAVDGKHVLLSSEAQPGYSFACDGICFPCALGHPFITRLSPGLRAERVLPALQWKVRLYRKYMYIQVIIQEIYDEQVQPTKKCVISMFQTVLGSYSHSTTQVSIESAFTGCWCFWPAPVRRVHLQLVHRNKCKPSESTAGRVGGFTQCFNTLIFWKVAHHLPESVTMTDMGFGQGYNSTGLASAPWHRRNLHFSK